MSFDKKDEFDGSDSKSNVEKCDDSLNVKQKLLHFFGNITVEPLIICYLIPIALTTLPVDNFNLEKACRVDLQYNETVCDALTSRNVSTYQIEDDEAQRLVAQMVTWKNALRSSLPAIIVVFVGSWSDRHARRKPLLLVPMVGELFTNFFLLLCNYYFFEWPLTVAGIVQGLFPALTGSSMVMIMAVFSYIGDVTSVEMRTFRMGIVNILVFLCVPVGTLLSGVLFKVIGFYGMFSAAAFFNTIGLLYGLFFIKEGREAVAKPTGVSFLQDFFDFHHLIDTFSVAFRKRDGSQRLRILLLITLFIAVLGPSFGEASVAYLFMRHRFGWDEVDASYFSAYAEFINFLGTLVMVGLFSRILKFDDTMIGIISCVSKIIASFVYAFSYTIWMFYLGPITDLLGGATMICIRSIGSKLVLQEELGRMNSLFGVCEAFAPFMYGPMFAAVYASTLHTMSGAFFLFSSALTAPAILFFMWMFILQKKGNAVENEAVKLASINYSCPSSVNKEEDSKHYGKDSTVVTASWD